eukprot:1136555-Pelagomonas_calceolata.AAC.3
MQVLPKQAHIKNLLAGHKESITAYKKTLQRTGPFTYKALQPYKQGGGAMPSKQQGGGMPSNKESNLIR